MRVDVLAAGILLACGSSAPLTPLRGELTLPRAAQPLTVTECGTGRIYELGVMANTVYYYFLSRAEELRAADPSSPLLVELQGTAAEATTSVAERGAQGVFHVRFYSMQHGSCSGSTAPLPLRRRS